MVRQLDSELRELAGKIVQMGGAVESAIQEAMTALIQRDQRRFARVHELEREINQLHMSVDEECLRLLARQTPVASDLRTIVAIIKINTDLERMGDQATNIAHNGKHYLEEPALKPLIDLPEMAKAVQLMVKESLDAFVRRDQALAQAVLLKDDAVDAFKDKIYEELKEIMKKDSLSVGRALNLILIARNLERLGDHATNIAEDVIFVISGQDVRHPGTRLGAGS